MLMENDSKKTDFFSDLEQIEYIVEHKFNVIQNGIKISKWFVENGDSLLGRHLIVRIYQHDLSKFFGIQWKYLRRNSDEIDKNCLALAVEEHSSSFLNLHHPEAFGGLGYMSDIDLAEMACDLASRSSEMKTDLHEYLTNKFAKRFVASDNDKKQFAKLVKFCSLLSERPFKLLKKV
jgi:hypothetical protein